MVDTADAMKLDVFAAKIGTILTNIATWLGFLFYIRDRSSTLPPSSLPTLDIVLHLGLLTVIGYGLLWALAERCFRWSYGAGGNGMPSGWAAVALSLSVSLPLALIPPAYQAATGVVVVAESHWYAVSVLMVLNVLFHLLIYGAAKGKRGFRGLREYILPTKVPSTFLNAVLMEIVYAVFFIGLIVVAYRLIVNPGGSLSDMVLGRAMLPCSVHVSAMAIFIGLKPDAMRKPIWIQVRGIIGAIVMMICLCGGLFL